MSKNKSIPLELPTGEAGVPVDDAPKPVSIAIDTAGDYFWVGERVSFDDLLIRINGLKAQAADPKILISGEIGAQFGKAVVVIDEARKAGIMKVTIDTKAKQTIR
ncbi:MAG: biopolymer transporter ExbD [Opitutaceae bacterium]|nr:biopolymer transporter ExbD [Opitutaceae bacterium]